MSLRHGVRLQLQLCSAECVQLLAPDQSAHYCSKRKVARTAHQCIVWAVILVPHEMKTSESVWNSLATRGSSVAVTLSICSWRWVICSPCFDCGDLPWTESQHRRCGRVLEVQIEWATCGTQQVQYTLVCCHIFGEQREFQLVSAGLDPGLS